MCALVSGLYFAVVVVVFIVESVACNRTQNAQAKKAKQQDIFGASMDDIWNAAGFGGNGRRRRREVCNGSEERGRYMQRGLFYYQIGLLILGCSLSQILFKAMFCVFFNTNIDSHLIVAHIVL